MSLGLLQNSDRWSEGVESIKERTSGEEMKKGTDYTQLLKVLMVEGPRERYLERDIMSVVDLF